MLPEERVADVARHVCAEMEGRREILSQRRSHSQVGFAPTPNIMIDCPPTPFQEPQRQPDGDPARRGEAAL